MKVSSILLKGPGKIFVKTTSLSAESDKILLNVKKPNVVNTKE